jgi:hypothetical protein
MLPLDFHRIEPSSGLINFLAYWDLGIFVQKRIHLETHWDLGIFVQKRIHLETH